MYENPLTIFLLKIRLHGVRIESRKRESRLQENRNAVSNFFFFVKLGSHFDRSVSQETRSGREFWTWTTPRSRIHRRPCCRRAGTSPARLCAIQPPTRTTLAPRTTKLHRCRRDAAATPMLPPPTFANASTWGIYRLELPSRSFSSTKVTKLSIRIVSLPIYQFSIKTDAIKTNELRMFLNSLLLLLLCFFCIIRYLANKASTIGFHFT